MITVLPLSLPSYQSLHTSCLHISIIFLDLSSSTYLHLSIFYCKSFIIFSVPFFISYSCTFIYLFFIVSSPSFPSPLGIYDTLEDFANDLIGVFTDVIEAPHRGKYGDKHVHQLDMYDIFTCLLL